MSWLPTFRSWRLNERHYGGLQGLNKAETAAEHGDDQVHIWRRSYDVPPPPAPSDDPTVQDRRYASVSEDDLPQSESLELTVARTKPYLEAEILPKAPSRKERLGGCPRQQFRGIVMSLTASVLRPSLVSTFPPDLPLVYEFDDDGKVISHQYLAAPERTEEAQAELDGASSS